MRAGTAHLAALALLAAAPAWAQDRPSEEELFGAPPPEAPAPAASTPSVPAAPSAPGDRAATEAELFGSKDTTGAVPPSAQRTVSRERDDPLRLGGTLYLRFQAFAQQDTKPGDVTVISPNVLDVFLDVRPNDRVRAFALARTSYDAVVAPAVELPPQLADLQAQPANPRAALDQLWVNFDVGRRLFVTAGRQHVKWGVGRFWNPTDFLHRQPRDPLDPFDVRTGTAMVKAHLPWERRGWNAYAVALLEDPRIGGGEAAGTLRGIPVGGRAEVVLGTVEVGADLLVGEGARPRWGLDVSAGVWELDLYAEAALGAARPRWRERDPSGALVPDPTQSPRFVLETPSGPSPQLTLGAAWSAKYSDEDVVTVHAEWFWQRAGYTDASIYPYLFFGAPRLTAPVADPDFRVVRQDPAAYSSFYLGRQYAGAVVALPSPGSWNGTTLSLSVLGNLTDRSFVARLDHSVLALTYLRLETFVQGHLGRRGGEFRPVIELPGIALPETIGTTAVPTRPPVVDVGVALRVSL
jgi:hypothetical protein